MSEIAPFVRFSWKSPEIARKYEPMKTRIERLCHQVEYEAVKRGLRAANVFHMTPQSFDKQIEQITLDGLVFLPILRSKQYQGYSHRHYPVESLDMNSFVYGVVARDVKSALEFREAHKGKTDHMTIGRLLGYPECCVKFFVEKWSQGILDLTYETAMNTPDCVVEGQTVIVQGSPFVNTLLRYFGFKICPFFACSFQCDKAIAFGKEWFDIMKELDKQAAEVLLEFLSMRTKWSMRNLIIFVEHPLFAGATIGFESPYREVIWSES